MAEIINKNLLLAGLTSESEVFSFDYSLKDYSIVTTYTVTYASNVEEHVDLYRVYYSTTHLEETVDRYLVTYSSIYGDTVKVYRVRYHSGRVLRENVDRYYSRYLSEYTSNVVQTYSVRYTSVSNTSTAHRARYRVRYTSYTAQSTVNTYKVRYVSNYFYPDSKRYTVRYTTALSESVLVNCLLLKKDTGYDALFTMRALNNITLDEIKFVFTNNPKYQLLEFTTGEELPYVDVVDNTPFSEFVQSDQLLQSVLIKDVDKDNGFSLDLFNIETENQLNRPKTFFFNLDDLAFVNTDISTSYGTYTAVNDQSSHYNKNFLNYVSVIHKPTFRFGADCCFSRKINKTSYSYCSPF